MTEQSFEQEMEDYIRRVFEQNYEELLVESGHGLAPNAKSTALDQVLLYWRVLSDIAKNVTDTEVRLSLPNQETPKGHDYTIEGIVDIVRENDRTIMYDIKTHNADYVRENIEEYAQQLNVYAHIWQNLRQQPLDGTAIIATDFPDNVRDALSRENEDELAYALSRWEPVVPIEFDPKKVDETIAEFGKVIDEIEDGCFTPPPLKRLNEFVSGAQRKVRFGTQVCHNCDARFSCKSYREYAWRSGRATSDRTMMQYLGEALPDEEQEAWRSGNLDASLSAGELQADFSTRGNNRFTEAENG